MKKLPISIFLALIVLITVGIQFLLLFFELPVFVIIAGFRFHIAITIPILFFLLRAEFDSILESVKHFSFKGLWFGLFIPFLSMVIVLSFLFFMEKISFREPELFYELGLSSIVDFPIYLIWNFIEIFIFTSIIKSVLGGNRFRHMFLFATILLLLSPEHIYLHLNGFNYLSTIEFIVAIVIISTLIFKFNSNYTVSIILFAIFWFGFLILGTNCPTLLKLFLGSNYTSWNGFFIIDKLYVPYLFTTYLLIISVGFLFKRRESLIQS